MDIDIRETFWKAFQLSPFIMMKLTGSSDHAEPMTARLDRDARHAIWFFCRRTNRIAGGGKAMGQVMTRGHEVFACIEGTLVEETSQALRDRHWDNAVEAWLPGGRTDPAVVMLRFDIADGEVWTVEIGLKNAWKLLTGKPIDPAKAGHHALGAV
ncbi:Pyridoxamine 5'-phosphate oxidase like [Novosphingobium sp. CF614]|uniref:pyridoxamine 5'-phosphate oxidase family protein n=1 Tax=Novosphingobium sp. CF614 TaxID=1884364 RepID=UPI0008EBCC21|nr:pyridoxamine 5'-phosphate oxidase family protein [Novosphingobium sp. CF614]SFG35037.1 Pyridoxamine 5'-phosphate oxidase like [Novosphingobium sp. CF614]